MNISNEARSAVAQDIADFLNDIQQTDQKLSREKAKDEGSEDIFENGNRSNHLNVLIEEIEKKKQSENERLKGNEYMKNKEFQDAIECYGKAIDLCPTDAATFSNRAMAHLKVKEFARALEDAESAIKLKEDYVKAYHRRGKAYLAMNKIEMAIRDFQYILEKEPHNKEAMQEIKNARKKLDDKMVPKDSSTSQPAPQPKNKFTKVAIQEESDEEEAAEATTSSKTESFNITKGGDEKEDDAPKKVLIEEVKQLTKQANEADTKSADWWKKSGDSLNYDDFKPSPKEEKKDTT